MFPVPPAAEPLVNSFRSAFTGPTFVAVHPAGDRVVTIGGHRQLEVADVPFRRVVYKAVAYLETRGNTYLANEKRG